MTVRVRGLGTTWSRMRSFSMSCFRPLHTSTILFNESKLNKVPIDRTRNIGIIAHIDAGKTTTTERMIYYSGQSHHIGNVDEGDTVTDFLPAERERGITIQSAAITIPWNQNKINIIDTPGHADFTFEVTRSLRVLDGVVTVLDAVAGVEAQTEKVWKQANELNIPKIAYINKMDREGAGFSRTVKEIIEKLKTKVVLCNIPYIKTNEKNEYEFLGVIDILYQKLLLWDKSLSPQGDELKVIDLTEENTDYLVEYEMLKKSRESMVETLGELDERIIDSFIELDEDYMKIPTSLLKEIISQQTKSNVITPVLCGASFKNIGVQPLLDSIIDYLPTPLEISPPEIQTRVSQFFNGRKKGKNRQSKEAIVTKVDKRKGLIINNNPNLTVALAFKVVTHPIRGIMTYFRVYSGKFSSNATFLNTRTGKKLQSKKLLLMHGENPEVVSYIGEGNIGVLTGSEDEIITGDTLVAHSTSNKTFNSLESSLMLNPIDIPPALFNSCIEPLTAGDERHMTQCIKTILREDPSVKVTVDEDLGQTILSGMGELHLEIIRERLIRDMKANVRLADIVVSYKETLQKPHNQAFSYNNNDDTIGIEIQMESFEGAADEHYSSQEEGAFLFERDNNIVVMEPEATPKEMKDAVAERRWKSEHTLEALQETLIQGCITALQMGGPLYGFPLNSVVIRIKGWRFPYEDKNVKSSQLLEVGRKSVSGLIRELGENSFTVLEPIMRTRVYVDSTFLGDVMHDLNNKCQATITSIDDVVSDAGENQLWSRNEAEKVYLPPDYTMNASGDSSGVQKQQKVINAETPLKEMVGYLSRLRTITQGRGVFDMSFLSMRRANKSRLNLIAQELKI